MPIHADRILYKDDHFLAVHKLGGELVVKGKGRTDKLPLFDFLRKENPGIHPINRLDLDTSGIVLFARNRAVLKAMLDGNAPMKKIYRAIVAGDPPRDHGDIRFKLKARSGEELVEALTRYHVLKRFGLCAYVEAEIQTGRHHQIRQHFQMIGHPLINDPDYGDAKANQKFFQAFRFRKFFLHAYAIDFTDPINQQKIHAEDPLPKTFEQVLQSLVHSAA